MVEDTAFEEGEPVVVIGLSLSRPAAILSFTESWPVDSEDEATKWTGTLSQKNSWRLLTALMDVFGDDGSDHRIDDELH